MASVFDRLTSRITNSFKNFTIGFKEFFSGSKDDEIGKTTSSVTSTHEENASQNAGAEQGTPQEQRELSGKLPTTLEEKLQDSNPVISDKELLDVQNKLISFNQHQIAGAKLTPEESRLYASLKRVASKNYNMGDSKLAGLLSEQKSIISDQNKCLINPERQSRQTSAIRNSLPERINDFDDHKLPSDFKPQRLTEVDQKTKVEQQTRISVEEKPQPQSLSSQPIEAATKYSEKEMMALQTQLIQFNDQRIHGQPVDKQQYDLIKNSITAMHEAEMRDRRENGQRAASDLTPILEAQNGLITTQVGVLNPRNQKDPKTMDSLMDRMWEQKAQLEGLQAPREQLAPTQEPVQKTGDTKDKTAALQATMDEDQPAAPKARRGAGNSENQQLPKDLLAKMDPADAKKVTEIRAKMQSSMAEAKSNPVSQSADMAKTAQQQASGASR